MTQTENNSVPFLNWGVAGQLFPGEKESGDSCLVVPIPNGALVAVIDGLGHGEKAAVAAKAAVETLIPYAHEPLTKLMERCHRSLVSTRGVVMSLATFDLPNNQVTWLGVGNVTGLLARANPQQEERPFESLFLQGGVVGYRLPNLRPITFSLSSHDLLILATDGLEGGFSRGLTLTASPQQLADDLLAKHGHQNDDALVLVAQYLPTS